MEPRARKRLTTSFRGGGWQSRRPALFGSPDTAAKPDNRGLAAQNGEVLGRNGPTHPDRADTPVIPVTEPSTSSAVTPFERDTDSTRSMQQ